MSRDIENLRRRLEEHRDALRQMEADAPAEALATRYAQLADWIERRLASLEIAPPDPALPAVALHATRPGNPPSAQPATEPQYSLPYSYGYEPEPKREGFRTAAVLFIGIAAAALLAFLFFQFFAEERDSVSEGPAAERVVEEPALMTSIEPVIVEESAEPPPPAAPDTAQAATAADVRVEVEPQRANVSGFGAGRAIQQFRVENGGSDPVRITIERSRCRCLWYDVQPVIPAGGGAVLEITVDGARLQGDRLDEQIGILEAGTRRRLAQIEISGYR